MNKKLICTSYNKLSDGTLQLRNNWIEEYSEDALINFNIKADISILPIKGISEILIGKLELPNTEIHIRIVKY